MTPLLIGIILALASLAFILYPIFNESPPQHATRDDFRGGDFQNIESQSAIDALREVEFDRATGKLSDADYASLRARYTKEAVAELRSAGVEDVADADTDADAAEALISRFRARAASCSNCGPRPEPDAVYCSDCGRFLPGKCSSCGAAVTESGAQFCSSCGARLAA